MNTTKKNLQKYFGFYIFVFIIFAIASWDSFEYLVDFFIGLFGKVTNNKRFVVYILSTIITLSIIIYSGQLELLAMEEKRFKSKFWNQVYQIFVGIMLIILWVAIWDAFEILVTKFLEYIGKNNRDSRLVFYLLVTLITGYIVLSRKQLDIFLISGL